MCECEQVKSKNMPVGCLTHSSLFPDFSRQQLVSRSPAAALLVRGTQERGEGRDSESRATEVNSETEVSGDRERIVIGIPIQCLLPFFREAHASNSA